MTNQQKANPANGQPRVAERKRIPMNNQRQKLSTPEIPGYVTHWFRGTPTRLSEAYDAFWEFVEEGETSLNNVLIGGDLLKSGNTDMGTRVSILAGGDELGPDQQPLRLYLMKLKQEYADEDAAARDGRSEGFIRNLKSGRIGSEQDSGAGDTNARYATADNMFTPRTLRK